MDIREVTDLICMLYEEDYLYLDKVQENVKIDREENNLVSNRIISTYGWIDDIHRFKNSNHKKYLTPWKGWDDLFYLRHGEITVVSGYSGHGKSQFVGQLAMHAIKQGAKVFFSSFELSLGNIGMRLLRQSTGQSDPTNDYIRKFANYYDKKLWAYDLMGNVDINEVLRSAQMSFEICKTDLFIFDNLMMLNALVDQFAVQHEIVQKLLRFAKDNNVIVILVAHSRKPSKGMPWPTMYDVAGSANIVNMVDNHLSVSKNLTKVIAQRKLQNNETLTDSEERSLLWGECIVQRDKKREIGDTFFKSLYFDKKFEVFKELESEKPFNYVEGIYT